jgi:hypothetical protein
MAHYIGLDVGTGSSRACLINEKGDILSVAVKDIQTWHDKADYYVRSSTELNRLIGRNNRPRMYGPHAVMLRSRLSRSQESTPLPSRGLGLMQLVPWSFWTSQTNLFPCRDRTLKTTTETLSSGVMYDPHIEVIDHCSTEQDKRQMSLMQPNILSSLFKGVQCH